MKPILLARAMRCHGWCYRRDHRGRAQFGIRFPNGFGVTKTIDLTTLDQLLMSAAQLADWLTRDAALQAGA